ncbi:intermembrane transport protein PqiB [Marinobacter daepoensis]|uniref:intermembrane transport protein PqiB n=1 Tax=Marinobacter daepoensis TaxID=262077 RepID=UPI001C941334|nr:intermembrane transport protein PqiB [Marinobacter daepoensis]MBY6031628.1 intermembrane transport protein PqiB [Marinobacter daepoensis]
MNEPTASVTPARKISLVWLLPILVLAIGGWVTVQYYLAQGPLVQISLSTAEGLEAGRTRVRALSVDIGVVEDIRLSDNLDGVMVTARLDPGTRHLLNQETKFWVVRPRITAERVSGLGTLLSGAYIELYPGKEGEAQRSFQGLDQEPDSLPGAAGLRVELYGESASSVTTGAPVLFRGLRVGRVESVGLSDDYRESRITVLIEEPYDKVITSNTRFWNASGINVSTSADGIEVNTQSLTALMSGGIAFSVPEEPGKGEVVEAGARFRLYQSQWEAEDAPYSVGVDYALLFHRSLRGLSEGAPVEYRGIRVGTVKEIMSVELAESDQANAVSVIIRVEPGRIGLPDIWSSVEEVRHRIDRIVSESGFSASLETGNVLTGELFVALDYRAAGDGGQVGRYRGYPTIPTVETGLVRLEEQLSTLLTKLNGLPMEAALDETRVALSSLRDTLDSVNALVSQEDTMQLPGALAGTMAAVRETVENYGAGSETEQNVNRSLQQLNATLREVKSLTETIGDQPSALLFTPEWAPDPEPKVRH